MANICLVYRLVWDWYYLKSLPACTGIKLVPDLGHTRLVWYLIPVLIPVSDPIYQSNTCQNLCKVLKNITRNWDCICTVRICTSYNYLNGWSQIAKMFPNNLMIIWRVSIIMNSIDGHDMLLRKYLEGLQTFVLWKFLICMWNEKVMST